jgi:hypothetical protein
MQDEDSLHVVPAPIGKKRIPVRATASGPWASRNRAIGCTNAILVIEGVQRLPTVQSEYANLFELAFEIDLVIG